MPHHLHPIGSIDYEREIRGVLERQRPKSRVNQHLQGSLWKLLRHFEELNTLVLPNRGFYLFAVLLEGHLLETKPVPQGILIVTGLAALVTLKLFPLVRYAGKHWSPKQQHVQPSTPHTCEGLLGQVWRTWTCWDNSLLLD